MTETELQRPETRVLAVLGEPEMRLRFGDRIQTLGHEVTTVGSATEAQEILVRDGFESYDCLLTDFWMPGQSGLDLLRWLRDYDPTLASVVISQTPDQSVVTRTLRGGASDFLRLPVADDELRMSLDRALNSTERRRRHAAVNSAVRAAGLVQRRMNDPGANSGLPIPLTVCYHPRHEAGGDSVSFFPLGPSRMMIVVADVSGHDIKSAFISAYFQGMLRALVEQKIPIAEVFDRFNRFLIDEWNLPVAAGNSLGEITSLSVCSAVVDLDSGRMRILNGGFPLAHCLDRFGRPRRCGTVSGNPLGWIETNPLVGMDVPVAGSDQLVVWTDGLEDFASHLGVNEWSLTFRILRARTAGNTPFWLAQAPDDILLILADFCPDCPPRPAPVFAAGYTRADAPSIDSLQEGWRHSLRFALPQIPKDQLFDILLCSREAVLNGLLHGCSGESDQCRLTMVFDARCHELMVEIADPGPGHAFDLHGRSFEDEKHRGLMLMHGLPQRAEVSAGGAAIRMFFTLSPEACAGDSIPQETQ